MADFNQFIDDLKNNIDIVEFISSKINLSRVGNKYAAICPFHQDTNKSFYIYPDSKSYYCFGCKATGDVIKFLQEFENISFIEALKQLAARAGMSLPENFDVDETLKNKKIKNDILEINKQAGYYYIQEFKKKPNPAFDYLISRQFDEKVMTNFGIGYSPSPSGLVRYMKKIGFSDKQLLEAKLVKKTSVGLVDFFEGRLIIPIITPEKTVVGFGARDLTNNKDVSKYVNSSESLVFQKKNILFGLNNLKKYLRTLNNPKDVIIVEGYMDVMALYQYGIENVVASMGTALTSEQILKLKACHINNVYFCYDGDSAGQNSMMRSFPLFKAKGLNIKVIKIPDKKDPDEYLKEFGKEKFLDLLNNARPYIEHIIDTIAEKYDLINSSESREKFAKEAIGFLIDTTDNYAIEAYLSEIYKRTKISEHNLKIILKEKMKEKNKVEENIPKKDVLTKEQNNLICFYIYSLYSDNLDFKIPLFEDIEIGDSYKKLINNYFLIRDKNEKADLEMIKEFVGEEEFAKITNSIAKDLKKEARIEYLKSMANKILQKEIQERIKNLAVQCDDENISAEKKQELQLEINSLYNTLRGEKWVERKKK